MGVFCGNPAIFIFGAVKTANIGDWAITDGLEDLFKIIGADDFVDVAVGGVEVLPGDAVFSLGDGIEEFDAGGDHGRACGGE